MTRENSHGGNQFGGDANGFGVGRGRGDGYQQRGGRGGYQDNHGRPGDNRPPFNRNRSFMSNNSGNPNYMGA